MWRAGHHHDSNIGTETHTLPVPYKIWKIWAVGALVVNVEQLVVIASPRAVRAAVCAVPLSKLGIAMQASSQNQLAA